MMTWPDAFFGSVCVVVGAWLFVKLCRAGFGGRW
jgi:hypothetical protein